MIGRSLSHAQITEGLAHVFRVEPSRIEIITNWENAAMDPDSFWCTVNELKGDYAIHLDVMGVDESLKQIECVIELAKLWGCDCLAYAGVKPKLAQNPYAMTHIDRTGATRDVFVDARLLDDENEYRIDRPVD